MDDAVVVMECDPEVGPGVVGDEDPGGGAVLAVGGSQEGHFSGAGDGAEKQPANTMPTAARRTSGRTPAQTLRLV